MAYTEYDYNSLAQLPDGAKCIIESSHSAKKDREVLYLGSVVGTSSLPTVNVEIVTTTDAAAEELYDWYNDTLIGGTEPFTTLHELFGRSDYYVLSIIDGLEEKIVGGDTRLIKFSAEVLGMSYPNYYINSPMTVLADGSISIVITPHDPRSSVTFIPENFDVFLDDVNYAIKSITKVNDILLVTPDYPITNYPTEVRLVHNVAENGLGVFDQLMESNDSTIERVVVTGTPYTSNDGEVIYLSFNRAITQRIWDNSLFPFTVQADTDTIHLSTSSDCRMINEYTVEVLLNSSRPLYEYEVVSVEFNVTMDAEIAPFIKTDITNHSTIQSPEANTLLSGSIDASGALTIGNMSIPQDRTYGVVNFSLELNNIDYSVDSAVQVAASLVVTNDFIVTDYVSTLNLKHLTTEWGFDAGTFPITNNSLIPRILPEALGIRSDGTGVVLVFDRELSKDFSFIGLIDQFSLTADGIAVPFNVDTYEVSPTATYYTFWFANSNVVYTSQVVLMSFGITDNIELDEFTDTTVINSSLISEPNHMISGVVATDGLTITCLMAKSNTETYPASSFEVHSGYLTFVPSISVEQTATDLVITLAEPIKSDAIVTIDHIVPDWGYTTLEYGIPTVNNSTVIGATYVSGEVVATGTYIIITVDDTLETRSYDTSEFEVIVDGTLREVISKPYSIVGSPYIWIYTQGIIIDTDVVTVELLTLTDPQIDAFGPSTIVNNSTEDGTVTLVAPVYEMNTAAIQSNLEYWLLNSASSGSVYNGRLCNASGGAWSLTEVNARYDYTRSTIDLSDGYYIDTGWKPSVSEEWSISGIYNVIMGVSYDIYVIHYKGATNLSDIYVYSSTHGDFPVTPTYIDVPYIPDNTETWKIHEEPPSIIDVQSIIYDMSTFNTI